MLLTWMMLPLYVLASRWILRDLGLSGGTAWLVAAGLPQKDDATLVVLEYGTVL